MEIFSYFSIHNVNAFLIAFVPRGKFVHSTIVEKCRVFKPISKQQRCIHLNRIRTDRGLCSKQFPLRATIFLLKYTNLLASKIYNGTIFIYRRLSPPPILPLRIHDANSIAISFSRDCVKDYLFLFFSVLFCFFFSRNKRKQRTMYLRFNTAKNC